jgi:HK97 family phage major capsid protein
MDIKSLNEQRNTTLKALEDLSKGELNSESRAKIDTMLAEVTAVDADIARVNAIEERKAQIKNLPGRPNPGESNDPEERVEVRAKRQKESLRKYLQTGEVETRDLLVSSTGGFIIPQAFDASIFEAQKSYGELLNLVSVLRTDGGNPMKIVLDDDTGNSTTVVTVGTDVTEVDPTITTATLSVDTCTTGLIKVDNGVLSDAGFDVESWIRDRFGIRYARGVSNAIYNGDGGNIASLASAFTTGITSSTSGVIKYGDFVSALAALDPAYQTNAVWAMSNSALGSVLALSDTAGRPLFLANYGSADQGFVGTILGKPVKLVTQMPTVAVSHVAVLLGDFKAAYTYRIQNPGLSILRLNERYAPAYQTGFVGFFRAGGVATIPNSSNPPVVAITIHA